MGSAITETNKLIPTFTYLKLLALKLRGFNSVLQTGDFILQLVLIPQTKRT